VLVESRDGEATPKIIDFGIAKATDPRLIDRSQPTVLGQVIGTPEYMSPEQAEMSVVDIDTRTDIYSMGVLLYVLLSGSLPFPSLTLRSSGFGEIQRVLLEEEPSRPSSRVSSADEGGIDCGIDSRVLARRLKGDLDWIVMKAIDKVLDRRYQSASELAADVRRYLADEPVLASAPGTVYRLGKFVRRHRVAVTGFVTGILLLLGGVVATTSQAIRATRAEHEARIQAALAADVNEFLVSMLAEANPANHPPGREVTVVEALETAAHMVDTGDRSPRLEAEVRRVVGETFHTLSRHDEAEEQTRAALEMLRGLDRIDPTEVARLEVQLGVILLDRGDIDGASLSFETARETFAAAGYASVLQWAEATRHLADLANIRGELEPAAELFEAALVAARTVDGDEATRAEASALIKLGALDLERMNLDSAEDRIREGLTLQRAVEGELHPTVADTLRQLAMVLSEKGQFEEADELLRDSLETIRSVYGEGHVRVALSLQNYGRHLLKMKPELAVPYLREAVDVLADLGNDIGVAIALDTLAAAQLDLGHYEEAEESFLRALELRLVSLPADHPEIAQSLNNIGTVHMRSGRYDRAEPMFEQALERFRRIYGDQHPWVAVATYNLGSTQSDAGRLTQALANLERAVDLAAGIYPEGHVNLAVMRAKYGECLGRLSRFAEAEEILFPAHTVISAQLGDEHWRTQQAAEMVAELYTRWDKPEEVEQ
jgi:tetratricopeptide (TPR) repeat protein